MEQNHFNISLPKGAPFASAADFYKLTRKALDEFCKKYGISAFQDVYQELEMACREAEFQRDVSLGKTAVSLHNHTFYELILVVSGKLQYLLGDSRFDLKRGDVILLPPGVNHCPLIPEYLEEPYERYVLWLNADFLHSIFQKNPELEFAFQTCQSSSQFLIRTGEAGYHSLLKEFQAAYLEKQEQPFCWELAGQLSALSILVQLNRILREAPGHSRIPAAGSELPDQILAYAENHFQENLSLKDMANHFFVSPSTISRIFSETIDQSFYQYLTRRRLVAAKERLGQGEAATQIFSECGFNDYSVFYKSFKKAFGISPREYQNLTMAAKGLK